MPDNTYTAKTRLLAPVPRSKRMRDANVTVATQSSSSQQVEQTWNRDTESVQDAEVLVPVAQPLIDILRLRNGNHIVNITVDNNGNLHVDAGLYSDSFISALGLNPDAPTPGGGGLDEDELWTILGGSSTNHHILPTYLDSVPWASVTGKPSWIGSSKPSYSWSEITGKPTWIGSSKPSYAFNEISGTVTISQGGTGATTAANARANLGTWSIISDSYNTLMPADGTTNNWIKIGTANTSYGLIPSQAGSAGSGHNYLGTSTWYWKYAYIDEIHGSLIGSSSSCTGNSATATRLIHVGNVNYTNSASIQGNGIWQYSDTSTNNRPMDYGAILQFSNVDNPIPGTSQHWLTQLWSSTGSTLKYRTRVNTGSWSNFYTILDSNNYSSYALPLAGGTVTGTLNIDSTNGYTFCSFSSTSAIRIFAYNNANYIQTGNKTWTAPQNLNITGYNTNPFDTLYVNCNNINVGSISELREIVIRSRNSVRNVAIDLTTAGNYGFYDTTGAHWILCSNKSTATTYIPTEKFAIGYSNGTSVTEKLQVSGNIYATGAVTAGASSSDKRLKKDIKQFNAMSIVDALRPIQFRWNNVAKGLDKYFDTDEIQYGLIAQECDKAMPGLAFKFKANDYYGVRYEKLIPVLLEAIKELKQDINQLKEARV